jgi:hypothetical protein
MEAKVTCHKNVTKIKFSLTFILISFWIEFFKRWCCTEYLKVDIKIKIQKNKKIFKA